MVLVNFKEIKNLARSAIFYKKMRKNYDILKRSWSGAVQKRVNLVDLEKCSKTNSEIFTRRNRLRHSREWTSQALVTKQPPTWAK